MKFTTESGSEYEIDTVAKAIRRLSGPRPPRGGMPADGLWRTYGQAAMAFKRLFIQWGEDTGPIFISSQVMPPGRELLRILLHG